MTEPTIPTWEEIGETSISKGALDRVRNFLHRDKSPSDKPGNDSQNEVKPENPVQQSEDPPKRPHLTHDDYDAWAKDMDQRALNWNDPEMRRGLSAHDLANWGSYRKLWTMENPGPTWRDTLHIDGPEPLAGYYNGDHPDSWLPETWTNPEKWLEMYNHSIDAQNARTLPMAMPPKKSVQEPTIPSWSAMKKHYLDTGSVTMPVYKAITDYRDVLTPILMKIRDGEPLTEHDELAVNTIARLERLRTVEDNRGERRQAFDDGYAYADGVLNAGGDIADLAQERKNIVDNRFDAVMESPPEQHPYEVPDDLESTPPEAKLREAIRYAAGNLGTDSRAYAADGAKISGIGTAITDHLDDIGDDDDELDSDDYEGGE